MRATCVRGLYEIPLDPPLRKGEKFPVILAVSPLSERGGRGDLVVKKNDGRYENDSGCWKRKGAKGSSEGQKKRFQGFGCLLFIRCSMLDVHWVAKHRVHGANTLK